MLSRPFFLALDVNTKDGALKLAQQTGPFVGGIKIGPRLCMRYGPQLVVELGKIRPIFVDHKYFDIPSTMEAAVEATFDAGASFVTVHASSGGDALSRLARLELRRFGKVEGRILAVTVLTSFSQGSLPPNANQTSIEQQVLDLARLVDSSGLNGLVCSPAELQILRPKFPKMYIVTPGIRLPGDDLSDQKRATTPDQAISAGASALVIGRPILEASNPATKAAEIEKICIAAQALRDRQAARLSDT